MKRTFKYALAAIIASSLVVPAFAQSDNFPDVPDNHWAYEALARMKKDGLLIGYPDGLFRGGRPATRYEMAVAAHAVYMAIKNVTDGVDSRVKSIEEKMGGAGSGDAGDLKAALAELKGDVASMKNWGQTIADLKKMADKFENELNTLGVDVEAMKKKLGDLEDRVTALEKKKLPVNISGDVNFSILGGYSNQGLNGITVDGRPTGVGRGSYAAGTTIGGLLDLDNSARVGADKDLTVLHEQALTLTSTNDTGAKWRGTLVFNNMTAAKPGASAAAFGNNGRVFPGVPFAEGRQSLLVQELCAMFDTSLMGRALSASVGRQGAKVGAYSLMRPDTTPYYANSRWDNGEYIIDGGNVGLSFGAAKLHLMAGRLNTGDAGDVSGGGFSTVYAGRTAAYTKGSTRPRNNVFDVSGAIVANTLYGATVALPVSQFNINLNYLWLRSETITGRSYNGVNVYGGEVKTNFGGKFDVSGFYSKADVVYNNSNVLNRNNDAYGASVKFAQSGFDVNAGWRQVNPFFGAPGDWGRIGIWWNPTDIKGFHANVGTNFGGFGVKAGYQGYTGTGKVTGGLSTSDKINALNLDVTYKLSGAYDLSLGYENVEWDLKTAGNFTGGKPRERWYNIGLGMNIAENSRLSFLWQISDYDSKGVAGFNPFTNSASGRAKGGLLSTQFTLKF